MNIAVKLVVALISMQSIGVHALKCYEYDKLHCVDDGRNAMMSLMCAFMETGMQNSTDKTCTIEGEGSCMKVTSVMTISGITMQSMHAACQSGKVDDDCYNQIEFEGMEDTFSSLDMGDMPSSAELDEFSVCFCSSDLCNTGSAVIVSWITLVNSLLLAATALCIAYKA